VAEWPYISCIQSAKTGSAVGETGKARHAVAGALPDHIADGRVRAGVLLPIEVQLAACYLVSGLFVRHAVWHLAVGGLVLGIPGRGTFAAPSGSAAMATSPAWKEGP
jgi:GntR family transcriptional regulator